MTKKKVDKGAVLTYEDHISKVYSSTNVEGIFHIIDAVAAEDEEKITSLCGDDNGFYLEDICDANLILMNDWQINAAKLCPACVAKREGIITAIANYKAEQEAEAAVKAAKTANAKAKTKTPKPAEKESKSKGKKKGDK